MLLARASTNGVVFPSPTNPSIESWPTSLQNSSQTPSPLPDPLILPLMITSISICRHSTNNAKTDFKSGVDPRRVCVSTFFPQRPVTLNNTREIIRDNTLINMSGTDDQWMGVDMNIEHLINFLKVNILLFSTGTYTRQVTDGVHFQGSPCILGSPERHLSRKQRLTSHKEAPWPGVEDGLSWSDTQSARSLKVNLEDPTGGYWARLAGRRLSRRHH
jgi:hypothetical protein